MINNYTKAKKYLDSFINYEQKVSFSYKKSLKLERTYWLLDCLDISYQNLPCIHIAGTKGKGSTAHFCAHLLAASGFRVGLYTSPHLFDFRERIAIKYAEAKGQSSRVKIKSCLIPKKDVVGIIVEFKSKLEKSKLPKGLGKISFFEIYTAVAFKYFLEAGVDLAILETGLGGRLDATNVISPFLSIITHIGYDHTDKLGRSLSDIAREKAGIIKRKTPLICASQRPAALRAIKIKSKKETAPLFIFGRDFKAENIRLAAQYSLFDFTSYEHKVKDLKISLKGKYQIENASCALLASFLLKDMGLINEQEEFRKEISNCFLEARFEIVAKQPLIIMDIAHNSSSFTVLSDNLKRYFPSKKIILIFACSKDKDAKAMISKIDYDQLILTSFPNPRCREPLSLKKICKLSKVSIAEDIREALSVAKKIYTKDHSAIVISGSLFLVAQAKKFLKKSNLASCTKD